MKWRIEVLFARKKYRFFLFFFYSCFMSRVVVENLKAVSGIFLYQKKTELEVEKKPS